MQASFGEVTRNLHAQAGEQPRGREERWRFERGQGAITDVLIATAGQILDAHTGDNVAIVVGSSSHAMHGAVGSATVGLARRAPVPVVIVP
jgi:nucleotide-binding universal stress UspA family protein